MLSRTRAAAGLLLAALALAGCEGGIAGGLRQAGIAGTPDEFMVLPTRPLEMPADLSRLPPPTPGAVNRVEVRPEVEAVASLSGTPGPAGAARADALIARAGPVDPAIRAKLRTEDNAIRRNPPGKLLDRLLASDREGLAYSGMTLDPGAEFERLRSRGLQVPASPPEVLAP